MSKCNFHRFCISYLVVKVKGHTGQGERSQARFKWGSLKGQMGSHQRQVASFFSDLMSWAIDQHVCRPNIASLLIQYNKHAQTIVEHKVVFIWQLPDPYPGNSFDNTGWPAACKNLLWVFRSCVFSYQKKARLASAQASLLLVPHRL